MKNLSKISIIPSLLLLPLLLFPPHSFPVSSPHAHTHTHTHLNFYFSPSSAAIVLYQLQLDHQSGGSVGRFRSRRGKPAHSAPPACSQTPVPGPAEALSQAGQRDTWPNRRNTSSCRLPDAHHGENSGQRWRSSPRTYSTTRESALAFFFFFTHVMFIGATAPNICS